MFNVRRTQRLFLCLSTLAASSLAHGTGTAAEPPKVDPRVQALISKHLRLDPSYAPGDLLTRNQVEPIYNEILSLGLQPTSDAESTYSPLLRESYPLAYMLRSPQGRALMRKIGNRPLAYDRLDRLTWLKGGTTWVEHLIAAPDGAELFEQLFSEAGLKKIEEQFADEPQSRNMNLPTGKIYTEAQLGEALTQSLRKQAERKAAAAKESAQPARGSSAGATPQAASRGA